MQNEEELNSKYRNGESVAALTVVALKDQACPALSHPPPQPPAHLHGDVPGQVDVGLVLVHPDLGHAQSVAPRVEGYVAVVGLLHPRNVSHPGAGQHLHAAAAQPHLEVRGGGGERGGEQGRKWFVFFHQKYKPGSNPTRDKVLDQFALLLQHTLAGAVYGSSISALSHLLQIQVIHLNCT